MSADVISMSGEAIPTPGEPNEQLIELLELLLERAKASQISGMIYVACPVTQDEIYTGWAGVGNRMHLLAGAGLLQYRAAAALHSDQG